MRYSQNAGKAYHEGIIHADLSEYNILMEEGRCVIIDWPQWIETSHPNAQTILERDIDNILTFFRRKYQITCDRGGCAAMRDRLKVFGIDIIRGSVRSRSRRPMYALVRMEGPDHRKRV